MNLDSYFAPRRHHARLASLLTQSSINYDTMSSWCFPSCKSDQYGGPTLVVGAPWRRGVAKLPQAKSFYLSFLPQQRFSWPRVARTSALPPSFQDGEQYLMRRVTGGGDRARGWEARPSVVIGFQSNRCVPVSMRPIGLTAGLHKCNGESSRVDSPHGR